MMVNVRIGFTEASLLVPRDRVKDQTLFLCQIQQKALQRTMFPVGSLLKSEVKAIAREAGLDKIATKKEVNSVHICAYRDEIFLFSSSHK